MAMFAKHQRCARCRDKVQGNDPCVLNQNCEYCNLLTPEQVTQLSTPTCKLRKEKQKENGTLVDPASLTVLSPIDKDASADLFYLNPLAIKNYREWARNGLLEWLDRKLCLL